MPQSRREPSTPCPCTAGEYSSKELISQMIIRLFETSTISIYAVNLLLTKLRIVDSDWLLIPRR
jgi:hypothetical protein